MHDDQSCPTKHNLPLCSQYSKKKVETIKHPKVVLTATNNIFRHFKETKTQGFSLLSGKKIKTNQGENLAYLSSIKVLSLIV